MGVDAVVAGLGPGGAYAAAALARAGLEVEAYDPVGVYRKACGDASPVGGLAAKLAEEGGAVVDEVKTFRVLIEGSETVVVDFPRRAWIIMDKSAFVGYLREIAESEGARLVRAPAPRPGRGEEVYVEARGPYAGGEGRILLYRIIARAPRWAGSEAILDYDVGRVGFYWVFPAGGGRVNVGVGWLNCSNCVEEARASVLKYAEKVAGAVEVLDEKAAPLRVAGPVDPTPPGRVVAVGEAAGLVVSISGEGIRPAVESGGMLGEAARACGADASCIRRVYARLVKPLVSAARVSRRLLGMVAKSSPRAARRVLESLPESFWRDFIAGRMDWIMVAKAVFERPGLLAGLARLLLSSRS